MKNKSVIPNSFRNLLFTTIVLLIALGVNCAGSVLAESLHIPLYLDSLSTIGVTALCGLLPGVLCAILSNVVLSFFGYNMIPFAICHVLTAFFAHLTFRHYKNDMLSQKRFTLEPFLWASLWSGLSNGILGGIIADIVFSLITGVPKADFMVKAIFIAVENLKVATYLTGLVENLCDKTISAVVSFAIYRIGVHVVKTPNYR